MYIRRTKKRNRIEEELIFILKVNTGRHWRAGAAGGSKNTVVVVVVVVTTIKLVCIIHTCTRVGTYEDTIYYVALPAQYTYMFTYTCAFIILYIAGIHKRYR